MAARQRAEIVHAAADDLLAHINSGGEALTEWNDFVYHVFGESGEPMRAETAAEIGDKIEAACLAVEHLAKPPAAPEAFAFEVNNSTSRRTSVQLLKVDTDEMPADMFTKFLTKAKVEKSLKFITNSSNAVRD